MVFSPADSFDPRVRYSDFPTISHMGMPSWRVGPRVFLESFGFDIPVSWWRGEFSSGTRRTSDPGDSEGLEVRPFLKLEAPELPNAVRGFLGQARSEWTLANLRNPGLKQL